MSPPAYPNMLSPCHHLTCPTTTSATFHFFRHRVNRPAYATSTTDDSQRQNHNSPSTSHSLLSLSLQDKANVNVLLGRRYPKFPGSISTLIEPKPENNRASNSDDYDDHDRIMRAIEVRRKVVVEILMEAMGKGKFGITYSKNVVGRLGGFIDHVLVEAATMKRFPEYREESFNSRVRIFVEDSNVVPLISYAVSFLGPKPGFQLTQKR